jgi:peptidyl-prolyl cis-trans isomerase C
MILRRLFSLLAIFGLILGSPLLAQTTDTNDDTVVIQLGETAETLSEFNQRFEIAMRSVAFSQGLELSDDVRAQLEPFKPQFLEQRGTELVLLREGEARGLSVPEEIIDEQIALISESLFEGETLDDFLAQAGFESEDELRSYIRENELIEQTVTLLGAEVTVTDEELAQAYEENQAAFTTPEQVCARHILVEDEELANELLNELEEDASFAELAAEYSIDPGSAVQGGDLGCFGAGQMVPEFEGAAFDAELDSPVGPVESQFGFHLIEVYDRQEAGVQPFEAVADQIRTALAQEGLSEVIDQLIIESELQLFPENL